MNDKILRELTRAELAALRKLVKELCANYDRAGRRNVTGLKAENKQTKSAVLRG